MLKNDVSVDTTAETLNTTTEKRKRGRPRKDKKGQKTIAAKAATEKDNRYIYLIYLFIFKLILFLITEIFAIIYGTY